MTPAKACFVSASTMATALVAISGGAQANIIYRVNTVTNAPVTSSIGENETAYTQLGQTATAGLNLQRNTESNGGAA